MIPSHYTALAIARCITLSLLFTSVPAEFWSQVVAILDVPTPVRVAVAPLLGSACATGVEFLIQLRRNAAGPVSAVYWPLKIFVGWIAGLFIGKGGSDLINAQPENIAFWSGISAYGVIALYLAKQNKEIDDVNKSDDDD